MEIKKRKMTSLEIAAAMEIQFLPQATPTPILTRKLIKCARENLDTTEKQIEYLWRCVRQHKSRIKSPEVRAALVS